MASEFDEQCGLFFMASFYESRVPELRMLYAVPNGGKRDIVTAARLKRSGVKAGVLDAHLPVARQGYHGLWIEMKHGKGRLSDVQEKWVEWLRGEGHRVEVCYSWQQAWSVLQDYLGVSMPLQMCP